MDWLGRARTKFDHSPSPVQLHLKDGKTVSLSDMAKSVTPPCQLNPFLFNGHLQTCWTSLNQYGPPIVYKRRIFHQEDERFAGTFTVDFVAEAEPDEPDESLPPRTTYYTDEEFEALGGDDDKPMLITLHGLTGGSYEPYLRHVLAPLVAKADSGTEGGWEAMVVNSRGCAGSKITSGIMYNARTTWDIRQVVKWARKKWPRRRLFGIGYSLGANMLTTYLGEEGADCELEAAVIVSSPWKLDIGSVALQSSWIGLEVYSKTMGTNLKKLFEKHREQIEKAGILDVDAVRKVKYIHDFDREVQCKVWGYPTEDAYYRDASSVDAVFDIRVPCFVIHAEDDPMAPPQAMPYKEVRQTPYVVICTTSLGGHLAWFELGGGRWHARPAVGFLEKMAREVDTTGTKKAAAASDTNGTISQSSYKPPFVFTPMRRKMHIPDSNS